MGQACIILLPAVGKVISEPRPIMTISWIWGLGFWPAPMSYWLQGKEIENATTLPPPSCFLPVASALPHTPTNLLVLAGSTCAPAALMQAAAARGRQGEPGRKVWIFD